MWPEGHDPYQGYFSLGELLRRKIESDQQSYRERILDQDLSGVEMRVLSHTEMNPCNEISLGTMFPVKRVVRKPSPTNKEPQMDATKLIALADPSWEKDLKDLGIISDSVVASELRAEIEAQAAENRKTAVKESATQILALGKAKQRADQNDVEALREIRRREKQIKDRLAQREAAWQYGSQTLNYLPLALDLGMLSMATLRGIDPELLKVKALPEVAAPAAE